VLGQKEERKEATGQPSTAHDASVGPTMEGSIMGTLRYMPPEQAKGEIGQLDTRSDVYSLGAILYHILTLKPPVDGGNTNAMLVKVCTGSFLPEGQIAVARRALKGRLELIDAKTGTLRR
jgi:serine/threonine protein kinase